MPATCERLKAVRERLATVADLIDEASDHYQAGPATVHPAIDPLIRVCRLLVDTCNLIANELEDIDRAAEN